MVIRLKTATEAAKKKQYSLGYIPQKQLPDPLNVPRGVKAPLGPQGSDDVRYRVEGNNG